MKVCGVLKKFRVKRIYKCTDQVTGCDDVSNT